MTVISSPYIFKCAQQNKSLTGYRVNTVCSMGSKIVFSELLSGENGPASLHNVAECYCTILIGLLV